MSIADNIHHIRQELPAKVSLVVVTKMQTVADIQEAYDSGHRVFGENKVQELTTKQQQLPADIEWHLLGHLQTNKVKYVAPFVALIHSVDSLKLLQELEKEAQKVGRVIDCLLEFYIAQEESKFGLAWDEALDILQSKEYEALRHVRICGVMGMASFVEDERIIRKEFKTLVGYFLDLQQKFFAQAPSFHIISMGMSGDYPLAVEEGSTMVRIGSAIFGARQYPI